MAQNELARRALAKSPKNQAARQSIAKPTYSEKYALSEMLICGKCDSLYRRCTWKKGDKIRIVWRCRNRLLNGRKVCPYSPTIDEKDIYAALCKAINEQLFLPDYLLAPFEIARGDVSMPAFPTPAKSMPELCANLTELQRQADDAIVELIAASANRQEPIENFDEIKACLDQRRQYERYIETFHLDSHKAYTDQGRHHLPYQLEAYNDTVARLMFDAVKVVDESHLQVRFKGGKEVTVTI